MKTNFSEQLALALDNTDDRSQLESLIRATAPWIGIYKIGLEQFIRFGPPVLEVVRAAQRKIFLDLKLHDIPNTVAQAVASACDLGVDYLTVHTQGGSEMLRAAVKARDANSSDKRPAIIGVTLLTSIGAPMLRDELNVGIDVQEHVKRLALLAAASGIDGIVCSAADLGAVTPVLPQQFIKITPGIRPAGSDTHDQQRIATPAAAIAAGATILVLGRAVTAATNPADAAKNICDEIAAV
jgi:orotidine-5'-phosphate decarboxylase